MKHVLVIRTIPEENKWYYNNTFLNFFLQLKIGYSQNVERR